MNQHPYDLLTPDTIIDAIESLGFHSDARILALNSYENRVYQVGIEDSPPVIAKFYRPERWSEQQILEEHQFTFELQQHEIPVVAPWTRQGQSLFEFNGFKFAVFERRGGRAPELDNLDNLEILGRYLGRIHAVGKAKSFNSRPAISVGMYATESCEFLLKEGFIPNDLRPAYESVARDLISALEQKFGQFPVKTIRIHGDCHPGNILWRDDLPHFVDFDDCLTGPAIQDLWMLLSGDTRQQTAQLAAILEGYEAFCEFDPIELNLVEAMRSLRLMHYAAWLARRWQDPAFPRTFCWFNTERYWGEHILELREQLSALNEPPLQPYPNF